MVPTYTQTQTVFALSLLSNVGSLFKGSLHEIEALTSKEIKKYLSDKKLIDEIGSWDVIWGPAIYQAPFSDRADNVMVVFQAGAGSAVPGQLVIGIAGTNIYSAFDWLLEDFWVITAPQWAYGNPAPLNPHISAGTHLGLSILQRLVPGHLLPGVGVRLRKFLLSILAAPTPITIAGHSLGGALSPAVALWLSDTKARWDLHGSSLACLPSAGPTSGDQDFSTYYFNQLGSVTTRLYNGLDVVPHAWEADDLVELPELYDPPISPTLELLVLSAGALAISASNDYAQICPSTLPLLGTFNQGSYDPKKSDCDNYSAQALYQHVDAYFDLVGVSIPKLRKAFALVADQQFAKLQSAVQRKQLIRKRSSAARA
jgi:hypothetical protein